MVSARTSLGVVALLVPALVGASCARSSAHGDAATDAKDGVASATSETGPLAAAFARSAQRSGVPRDLLVAVAHVEDGLLVPRERPEIAPDAEVPAAGPLQLRRGRLDTLARGAQLAFASEIDLRKDSDLALEAGALVLAELGARTGATADDLGSWSRAVAEMSGFSDLAHREDYVHRVFATLARGGRLAGRDGEIVELSPRDVPPSLTVDVSHRIRALAQAEYEDAEWIPTSCEDKCTEGRDGFAVELLVIHDTEAGWNASVATLQNDPDKSAHYIVGVDGRVGQFVTEDTTAWHAGNFHVNQRSIGIEHVGFATQPFPEALYASSAKLVDRLATKYGIPRDRAHIIGHDQVPNGKRIGQTAAPCLLAPRACQESPNYGGANHHTDPGIWDWATFMPRFGGAAKCNDAVELWRCDHSQTRRFRCVTDEVEVETCAGSCRASSGDGAEAACIDAPPAPPPDDACTVSSGIRPDVPGPVAVLAPAVMIAWAVRRRRPRT